MGYRRPSRGSPALSGARPWEGRASASAGLGHVRPTLLCSLVGALRCRLFAYTSLFRSRFLWFSGLFSKHRSRIDVILEPLRSYLRYGHNGSCFVGFRGRLTLQTPRNVEGCRENGLSGTQEGVPCLHRGSAMGWPSLCVCGARPWPTHMAELPCWGARGSARRRRFALLSVFPWFSGLFSKHLSLLDALPISLRGYLRYGHNGSCFVGFRGRLTLQTPRNVEGYRRK